MHGRLFDRFYARPEFCFASLSADFARVLGHWHLDLGPEFDRGHSRSPPRRLCYGLDHGQANIVRLLRMLLIHLYQVGFSIGTLIGPPVGGALYERHGYYAPFYFAIGKLKHLLFCLNPSY